MESQVTDLGPLVSELAAELDERLGAVDAALAAHYPGARPGRQPVHTVYVPADRFHARLVPDHGATAVQAVDEHESLLLGLLDDDVDLLDRVRDKLAREPVEDLRIDFEDGYGMRPDEEEGGDARRAAAELRTSISAG
ncbi:MAG TPA: aldolase, partial [Nocardioides sp.]